MSIWDHMQSNGGLRLIYMFMQIADDSIYCSMIPNKLSNRLLIWELSDVVINWFAVYGVHFYVYFICTETITYII